MNRERGRKGEEQKREPVAIPFLKMLVIYVMFKLTIGVAS